MPSVTRSKYFLNIVILAQVIVFAAYRFGGEIFSFTRMSWIKPTFLWMMYRSGWASKKGQEHVLAVRIMRASFDQILSLALTGQAEKAAGRKEPAQVRLQWDPDHGPNGDPLPRRAIQLGLRNEVIKLTAANKVAV